METETNVVTEGVVARAAVTEEVTVSNGELASEEVTDDDEGSIIDDKLENDVELLTEEETVNEEVLGKGEFCFFLVHEMSDSFINNRIKEIVIDQKLFKSAYFSCENWSI